jgi:hypothetical protein
LPGISGAFRARRPKLPGAEELLTALAAYFRVEYKVSDEALVQLTAARAGGGR